MMPKRFSDYQMVSRLLADLEFMLENTDNSFIGILADAQELLRARAAIFLKDLDLSNMSTLEKVLYLKIKHPDESMITLKAMAEKL